MQTFYSNGKLLITGEYVVLDGALSLAVPTKHGQILKVKPITSKQIIWKSLDDKGKVWFEDEFYFENKKLTPKQTNHPISEKLSKILNIAKHLNTDFLKENHGFEVETKLSFPKNWGLGSSSTLINNIADWATVDAYKLLELTFGGSGYDIACAQNDSVITYQIIKASDNAKNDSRTISKVDFNPNFNDCLYFIHLNRKQNSREGIEHYKKYRSNITNEVSEINDITSKIIDCNQLNEFETLIEQHEAIISKIIKIEPIKNQLFKDFNGSIKSLGAWGGDFVLATSIKDPTEYFKNKGFETIIPFDKMILK